jgi:hypothetical protein
MERVIVARHEVGPYQCTSRSGCRFFFPLLLASSPIVCQQLHAKAGIYNLIAAHRFQQAEQAASHTVCDTEAIAASTSCSASPFAAGKTGTLPSRLSKLQ